MRDTLTAALRLSAVAATLAVAAPNTAIAATSHWTLHKVPVEGEAVLTRVAAPSRTDAWAVGFSVGDTGFSSLALRWDGKAWSKVPIPDLGRINDVAATSSKNAWAVGDGGTVRWNGRTWRQVPLTTVPGLDMSAMAVASAPGGTWAVGNAQTPGEFYRGWIQRWDGTQWRSTPTTNLGDFYWFDDVAVHQRDAWVVGAEVTESGEERGIVLRWDGRSWDRTPIPETPGWSTDLSTVRALSTNDVWALGYTVRKGEARRPLALHWDGHRWSRTQVPDGFGQLNDTAVDRGTLWAVGYAEEPTLSPYALRWTGTRWETAPAPPVPQGGSLFGLSAIPGGGLWTTGAGNQDDNRVYPVIAHHD